MTSLHQNTVTESNDRGDGPTPPTTLAAKARAVLDRWTENVGRRDIAAVLELYAPDAILVPTMSDEVRERDEERRRYFESFLANDGIRCGVTAQKARVNQERGTVAIGGHYCFTLRRDGHDEVVPARFLFTFEEVGGRWLITSHHSSQAVE